MRLPGAAHGLVAAENPAWASRCLWMEQHHDAVPATEDIIAACTARLEGDPAADGKPVGTRLWGPYVFRLAEGAKLLRVEVANTPAGRMDGVSLPSGMLG